MKYNIFIKLKSYLNQLNISVFTLLLMQAIKYSYY